MRAVIQRVSRAGVAVENETVSSIEKGLLVFVGVCKGDTEADGAYITEKTVNLRIFEDENGKMNLSARDLGLEVLVVSQFTLLGDARKGRRPSFIEAGSPQDAKALFEKTVEAFRGTGLHIETGIYQADMEVSLVNDGPVTILLDSRKLF